MNTEDYEPEAPYELSMVDEWMLSKLHTLVKDVDFALETYRFDLFASAIYEFAWHEYCDWYLELAKPLHQPHLENFFASVRDEATLNCDARHAFESEAPIFWVNESALQKQPIVFTPEQLQV